MAAWVMWISACESLGVHAYPSVCMGIPQHACVSLGVHGYPSLWMGVLMGARRQGQTGSADPPWKSQLTLDMSALSAHLHWPLPVCIIARACCTAGSSHKLLISSAALALAALLRLAQRPGPAAIQARFYWPVRALYRPRASHLTFRPVTHTT